jgi:hypothetical protein
MVHWTVLAVAKPRWLALTDVTLTVTGTDDSHPNLSVINQFSTFRKLRRIIALCLRFADLCKKRITKNGYNHPSRRRRHHPRGHGEDGLRHHETSRQKSVRTPHRRLVQW